MQAITTRPRIVATADGTGMVAHCESGLLAEFAGRDRLTGESADPARSFQPLFESTSKPRSTSGPPGR